MQPAASIADLRKQAQHKLPKPVFDFIDGAGFEEATLRANCDDFAKFRFQQRVARNIANRKLATQLVGQDCSMPVAISATGMSGILRGSKAEILAARAAQKAGIPFTLGMMSIASLDEVAAALGSTEKLWFQLCPLKDRGVVQALVDRAQHHRCPVLIVTVTWPTASRTNRFIRNRTTSLPPKLTLSSLLELARTPRWTLASLLGGPIKLGNFEPIMQTADLGTILGLLEDEVDWSYIAWLREIWPGKLILKGVMHPDDTRAAFDAGVDAVSVSNHGGNCLDQGQSTIAALPGVVEAANGRGEVLLDGGVRSGQDVLKAMALGAKGCLLGRAHLFGLAADGEAGVSTALDIIRTEIDLSLAFSGVRSVDDVSRDMLATAI